MKFGAIDVGSNAVRLLIAKVHESEGESRLVEKLSFYRVPLRLGSDVFSDGAVSEKKIKLIHRGLDHFSPRNSFETESLKRLKLIAIGRLVPKKVIFIC